MLIYQLETYYLYLFKRVIGLSDTQRQWCRALYNFSLGKEVGTKIFLKSTFRNLKYDIIIRLHDLHKDDIKKLKGMQA